MALCDKGFRDHDARPMGENLRSKESGQRQMLQTARSRSGEGLARIGTWTRRRQGRPLERSYGQGWTSLPESRTVIAHRRADGGMAVSTGGEGGASFCGHECTAQEITLIQDVVGRFPALSRMELANTVCELLDWKRANGGLKGRECWEFLERLEAERLLHLPAKQRRRPFGSRTRVPLTPRGAPQPALVGTLGEFAPVVLERVQVPEQRALFRELVGRYHYLGHAMPFGAHLRYLVSLCTPVRRVVGCVQFSSAAWRIAVRDQWIGWSEAQRRRQLARVVNNSRFLILPWVRVKNLASAVLALSTRRLVAEWHEQYGVEPLLVETLVEPARYAGTCYRAANWLALGLTTGRGRMDRTHQRHGAAPKTVWVYPLVSDAVGQLRGGRHGHSRPRA